MLGALRTPLAAALSIALAAASQAAAQAPIRYPAPGARLARASYSPRPQDYPVVRPPVPNIPVEPPLYSAPAFDPGPGPGPRYTPRPEAYPQAAPIFQGPVVQQPIVDQWPTEIVVGSPAGPACAEPATLAILAEQIVYASDAFVQVFGPTACIVPDGRSILNAASEVHESGLRLRQAIQCGAPRHEVRKKAEAVFNDTNRLARRVSHVAKGRTGPNIRQAAQIFDLGYQIRHAAY